MREPGGGSGPDWRTLSDVVYPTLKQGVLQGAASSSLRSSSSLHSVIEKPAISSAVARPMPEPDPVTSAT